MRAQITNYELGILIPLRSEEEIEKMTCWERPPQKYVLGRDEPWVRFTPFYFDNGAYCIYATQIQSESTVLQAS